MSSSFSSAWLSGEPRAVGMFPDRFRHSADRLEAVKAAAARGIDPEVVAALVAQNAALPPSAARDRNLALLAQPGTTVVVTGQQVGLFLGPLFTLYKAASAIADARALAEESGRPCVPIFWLQTEDHDLPEIDHCFVSCSSAPLRVALAPATSRIPVAHCSLGPSVTSALAALRAELGSQPHAAEHLDLLERAYRPTATLTEAFAEVAATLFADDGLIFCNPRDPRLARLAAPVHRLSIQQAAAIAATLIARGRALTEAGFVEQVHVRPGAPLGFFSPGAIEGPRYRLDPAGPPDTWSLVGEPEHATVTTQVLLDWLEREPLRFTTSALLRPLVQDTLFPTAAYVGGPAELSYFAQLAPLYASMELPMPLVVPRSRFRIVESRSRRLLDQLALSPDDLTAPVETLLARIAAREAGFEAPETVEARLLGGVVAELKEVQQRFTTLDPNLAQALERTEKTIRLGVSRLIGKYRRALGLRNQVTRDRLERLRAYLLPNGAPQERIYGMSYFACRFGTAALLEQLRAATTPFSAELKELRLMESPDSPPG